MKKFIVALFLLLTVVGILVYRSMYGNVTLSFSADNEIKVSIYKNAGGDGASTEEIVKQKPIINSLSSSGSIKLRRGSYRLVSENNENYDNIVVDFAVSKHATNLDIAVKYSPDKLKDMLAQEQEQINNAIVGIYPGIKDIYTIDEGILLVRGEWYATKLLSKSSYKQENDTLRLVANKKGGDWTIVTTPPDLIISSIKYKDIPRDVIKAVNDL